MDENEGVVGGGGGNEQFHRNEAISAVVDEGFLGEEDDDYEDLYNDVNVGEGFLQSMRKNEDVGFRNDQDVEKKLELPPVAVSRPLPPPPQPPAAVADAGGGVRKFESDDGGSRFPGRVDPNFGAGVRVNEVSGRGSGEAAGGGLRVELGQASSKAIEDERVVNNNGIPNQGMGQQQISVGGAGTTGNVGNIVNAGGDGFGRQVGGNMNGNGGNGYGNGPGNVGMVGGAVGGGGGGGGGGTVLFVGDLHWWTTDAELESELCKYGHVKEVKFFDEKASGKSKGYCQVEFYDPSAATACKEGMNGHAFNGRPCVVAFASPYSVKRMGEAQVNRNQQVAQAATSQPRRGPGDAPAKPGGNAVPTGANFQGGGGENNRSFGRGNWGGRGNAQGMGGRGPVGPMRNRGGGMGGRGMMGNGGNGFGQGIGATPPMLHPQNMMGQGFDPAFGGPMGRMGNYGGFPGGPTPPFSGMMSSFPPVGNVGLPGVAPHVNPAFFGRGMPMNGMGMMPNAGVDGPNMGMWSDPNMAGWGGEDHAGRGGESSYGEEAASEHQYGEGSHERGPWPNAMKEKDRGAERDWSASSDRRYREEKEPGYDRDIPREKDIGQDQEWPERRHRDDRDVGRERERERDRDRERSRDRGHDRERDRERDRDRHRDDRDRYAEHHRYREREPEYDDEWEKGRSSRTHSKSRIAQEEEQRSRSRDADYGKRRRITSE